MPSRHVAVTTQLLAWRLRQETLEPNRIVHHETGYKSLMKAVAHRRKQLGIPQAELDRIVGCADGYVAKCECGTRTPSAFMLWCFADALNADLTLMPRDNEQI